MRPRLRPKSQVPPPVTLTLMAHEARALYDVLRAPVVKLHVEFIPLQAQRDIAGVVRLLAKQRLPKDARPIA